MENILINRLRGYLAENNPDVIIGLDRELSLTSYLEDQVYGVLPLAQQLIEEGKPQYIIEELCMNELTSRYRPSRFLYIRGLLEDEFLQTYSHYREAGVLTYETLNLMEVCKPTFDQLGFTTENEDNRQLRYAITGHIGEYLENN